MKAPQQLESDENFNLYVFSDFDFEELSVSIQFIMS